MNCCMPPPGFAIGSYISNRNFILSFSKIFIPNKYWVKRTSPSLKQDLQMLLNFKCNVMIFYLYKR